MVLFCANVNAQIIETIDTIQSVDTLIENINKSSFTSNVLYNRVYPIAELNDFNEQWNNTSNLTHFEQALKELHKSSNQTKFAPVENLRENYAPKTHKNIIDVGVINAKFHILNYMPNDEESGAFHFNGTILSKINNTPSFLEKQVLIIAPLKTSVLGQSITFNFKNDFVFEENDNKVINLTADFNTGAQYAIITNGVFLEQSIPIQYSEKGEKTITFTATFSNGTTKTTYGKLQVILPKLVTLNNGIENRNVTATIPFTGYEPNDVPVLGKIDCRIFYRGLSGNYEQTLEKPIVIIDGFDPFDKRKIQESDYPDDGEEHPDAIETLMSYKSEIGQPSTYLIPLLRELGYDVVIVNHPVYETANGQEIDGGADYIERNAMAHIQLYQELNAELLTNGSNEQLVVIGPSMGGQISRYALAYMEEHDIDHNVRLWVSVDSPHLGANIPMAAQANLYFLGYIHGDQKAKDQYDNLLNSPAGKQQLLLQHSYNSTSFPPYFQQYHANLESNLSEFSGFPQSTRAITMVNGSLSKSNHSPGKKVLDIRGFKDFFWGTHKGFQNQEWFIKNQGQNNRIFFGKVNKIISGYSMTTTLTNPLVYGSLDASLGGTANAHGNIKEELVIELAELVDDISVRTYIPRHSFVPTVSALNFINPNFNWGQPLNRNLLCTEEIPFDNYYGELGENTAHISFTEKSANWLFQELSADPINGPFPAPTVYLTSDDLIGPKVVCYNETPVYYFEDCKLPGDSVTWEVSDNLYILSSTDTSITVKSTSQDTGAAWIKAVFNGEILVTKHIVGKPAFNFIIDTNTNDSSVILNPIGLTLGEQEMTDLVWTQTGGTGNLHLNNLRAYNLGGGAIFGNVSITNTCGTTIKPFLIPPPEDDPCEKLHLNKTADNRYRVERSNPCNDDDIPYVIDNATLFNVYGVQEQGIEFNEDEVQLDNLEAGTIKIIRAQTEEGKIVVKRVIIDE